MEGLIHVLDAKVVCGGGIWGPPFCGLCLTDTFDIKHFGNCNFGQIGLSTSWWSVQPHNSRGSSSKWGVDNWSEKSEIRKSGGTFGRKLKVVWVAHDLFKGGSGLNCFYKNSVLVVFLPRWFMLLGNISIFYEVSIFFYIVYNIFKISGEFDLRFGLKYLS